MRGRKNGERVQEARDDGGSDEWELNWGDGIKLMDTDGQNMEEEHAVQG